MIIGLGNGLAPTWCQAITWTNSDIQSLNPKEETSMKFKSK